MAVSILEALMNAEHNLRTAGNHGLYESSIGLVQLHNAVVLLEKGYGPHDLVEPLLEEHGRAEAVPDKR